MKQPNIVVIGGGTGSFTVLSGLKRLTPHITALVNMSDDGGSTGKLRDELGVLPPGDVRQCLVALSDTAKLRDLFDYRFDAGGLKGHNFGNIFLSAIEKMTGSFAEGVELASRVLNITGAVEPVTLDKVTLCMNDGSGVVKGEFKIGHAAFLDKRPEMWLEPVPIANPKAIDAINNADIIVVAPGNIYGSLAPALIVPGIGTAICKAKAKKVYVCNLATKPKQTDDFSVQDFGSEINRFIGSGCIDFVLYNTTQPDLTLLEKYSRAGEQQVQFDTAAKAEFTCVGADLLATSPVEVRSKSDAIARTRTLIRHDPDKLATEIMKLVSV